MNAPQWHRRARSARAKLGRLPNVIGYAWGVRVRSGRNTREPCLTVFVARKVRPARLETGDTIPTQLKVGGKTWVTDVVRLSQPRLEFATWPVRRGAKLGTSSLYATDNGGSYVASCAHVFAANSTALINAQAPEYYDATWRSVGSGIRSHEEDGAGTNENWGAFDAAIAAISDQTLLQACAGATPVAPFDHAVPVSQLMALRGAPVYAETMRFGRVDAQVIGVCSNDTTRDIPKIDLLIRAPDGVGLTQPGDSGLVWRLADGTPLGMHFAGYNRNSQDFSTVSAAFFVNRIAQQFGVNLRH